MMIPARYQWYGIGVGRGEQPGDGLDPSGGRTKIGRPSMLPGSPALCAEYTYAYPHPVVEITGVQELARDLVVIPDRRVPLVPNIGIIGSTHSVLVVETGMGPGNAGRVLKFAADYARGRRLYLTTTHFHPEHAFGAQVFAGEATFLINRVQAEDLATRGPVTLSSSGDSAQASPGSLRVSNYAPPMSSTTIRTTWTWAAGSCNCGPPGKPTRRAIR